MSFKFFIDSRKDVNRLEHILLEEILPPLGIGVREWFGVCSRNRRVLVKGKYLQAKPIDFAEFYFAYVSERVGYFEYKRAKKGYNCILNFSNLNARRVKRIINQIEVDEICEAFPLQTFNVPNIERAEEIVSELSPILYKTKLRLAGDVKWRELRKKRRMIYHIYNLRQRHRGFIRHRLKNGLYSCELSVYGLQPEHKTKLLEEIIDHFPDLAEILK